MNDEQLTLSLNGSMVLTESDYKALYEYSINHPEQFWAEQAKTFVTWFKPWDNVQSGSFANADMKWFEGGKLNVSYNCLDRHLATRANQTAIIWEGDDPAHSKQLTYAQLHKEVCKFANVLKNQNVKKGDRVCIYMPMIPEVAIAMLACTRIGAIHSIVFGGFSAEALKNRIQNSDCSLLITADESVRGGKQIPLKNSADQAVAECPQIRNVIIVRNTGNPIAWNENKDIWYHDAMADVTAECPAVEMDAEDPLFILYTSGSTGKPKGVLHTTGGYLVYAAMTHKYVFNYQEGDIYWCTADVGWITGHSYSVYGPLANGATTLMFEGVPNYPTPSRCWEVIDKHNVNIFYTAPTAIRALMREGDDAVKCTRRDSLKLLGTVGEPINPDVWKWYHRVVGNGRCEIVDTWWQTETGGIIITPLPGATQQKPGAAAWPFFGVTIALVDQKGAILEGENEGQLVITTPWPGMMRTVFGNHQRFIDTYFKEFPGNFYTGDNARRDSEGYYWISGRADDVINVSGHRLGTAEIESALVEHPDIAEAAVVGIPDDIKGQGIYAYVTPKIDVTPSEQLKEQLIELVHDIIGPIAKPDKIQWAKALPKTRSGKIMRRILRKIANHEVDKIGDTSTLADPDVIKDLVENNM